MKINQFVVPAAAYPRYNYSRKHVLPLVERYRDLLEQVCLKDIYPLPIFGDVRIYVIHDESSVTITPKNLALKYTDKIECSESPYPPHEKEQQTCGIGIYVATHKHTVKREDILVKTGKHLILLLEAGEISSPLSRGIQDEMIYTSTVANVPSTLNALLESIVFRSLFERVKVLQCFLELENPTVLFATLDSDTKSGFKQQTERRSQRRNSPISFYTSLRLWWEARFEAVKRIVQSQYRKTPREFTENLIDQLLPDDTVTVKYPELHICEALLPVLNIDQEHVGDNYKPENIRAAVNEEKNVYKFTSMSNELSASFKKHIKLVAVQANTTEELHGEIQGMYYRSKIPPFEKPKNTIEINETLDEKVARRILRINGVTGVGYRYRILDIFLKDSLTDIEQTESEKSLLELLRGENITKYLFHIEQEHISSFAEVGSTISTQSSGTLGGFARLGKEKHLCVLLARHVAEQGGLVYLKSATQSKDSQSFAHVLQPKNVIQRHGSLDIALAQVSEKYKKDCIVQFKDEEGNCRASEVCRYDNIKWLSGLPVHLWGATSSPGLGKVVIPVLYMKDMEEKLMRIADRRGCMKAFARPGDSGAVVCANDQDEEKVYILAMVIGESCPRETAENSKEERVQYVSFRLINGLQQLENEQKEEIEPC